jgi:predicted dehydrogenase
MEPVGVGIIGLGFIGRVHAQAIAHAAGVGEPCALVAVCDRNPDRRAGRSEAGAGNLDLGDQGPLFDPAKVRGYELVEDMLNDPRVNLVIICTHTRTHVDLAMQALRAGKHVLVEKPVSLDPAEVRRLEQASAEAWKERGLRCMPGMCMRFWPGWDWLRDLIASREHGELRSLTLQRMGSRPGWAADFYGDLEASGGAMGDLHIHDTDFVCWALGLPEAVTTRGTLMHCTTLYAYPNVPHVAAEGAWDLTPGTPFRMKYLAVFEHATAEFDLSREPRVMLYTRDGAQQPALEPGAGYLPQLRHLIAAIRDPSLPLRATVSDAGAVAEVLAAERRSMQSGQPVSFSWSTP